MLVQIDIDDLIYIEEYSNGWFMQCKICSKFVTKFQDKSTAIVEGQNHLASEHNARLMF